MKYVALSFAVAFVLALALVVSIVIRFAGLGFPASEMMKRGGEAVVAFAAITALVMLLAAIITLLYGVTRRLYHWAVK